MHVNTTTDYYQILGVLHNAEQIVIAAAYRALASRYHPDRWPTDNIAATCRMSEINAAYAVIGVPKNRLAYDQIRSVKTNSFVENADLIDEAFDVAMQELESRWEVAVSLIPDLQKIRDRLEKTAHGLAFSFVVLMLERKKFQQRIEIAQALERSFLECYFGENAQIIGFAKLLISIGHKQALKLLNNYVEVVGSGISSKIIIQKVSDELQLKIFASKQIEGKSLRKLKDDALRFGDWESVLSLTKASGFDYTKTVVGIFATPHYEIYTNANIWGERRTIVPPSNMIDILQWVKLNLC